MDADQIMRQHALELALQAATIETMYWKENEEALAVANKYYEFMKSGTLPKTPDSGEAAGTPTGA